MSSVNKITLMGTVTGDVDIKVSDQGVSRARLTLSVQRVARPGAPVSFDEIPLLAWGEVAESIHKTAFSGSFLLVKGRILVNSFDDQHGNRKWVTEIDVRDFQVLQSTTASPQASSPESVPTATLSTTETQAGIAESDFDFSPLPEEKETVPASRDADTTFSEQLGDDVPF